MKNPKHAPKILKCNCNNEYQDNTYGKSMRVHNAMVKAGRLFGYRCTVCGKEKQT